MKKLQHGLRVSLVWRMAMLRLPQDWTDCSYFISAWGSTLSKSTTTSTSLAAILLREWWNFHILKSTLCPRPEDDVFQPYKAQRFSSSYTPSHGIEPYMLRSAFINTQHCSYLPGASNYAVSLDSNSQARPTLVPSHQMGYCSQSQGYGTHLDNNQYAPFFSQGYSFMFI